jgi:hypothetical protein
MANNLSLQGLMQSTYLFLCRNSISSDWKVIHFRTETSLLAALLLLRYKLSLQSFLLATLWIRSCLRCDAAHIRARRDNELTALFSFPLWCVSGCFTHWCDPFGLFSIFYFQNKLIFSLLCRKFDLMAFSYAQSDFLRFTSNYLEFDCVPREF